MIAGLIVKFLDRLFSPLSVHCLNLFNTFFFELELEIWWGRHRSMDGGRGVYNGSNYSPPPQEQKKVKNYIATNFWNTPPECDFNTHSVMFTRIV
jgi:hypothetical protein